MNINLTPEWVTAVATIILVLTTIIYVYFAGKLTQETVKLREVETTPFISISFDISYQMVSHSKLIFVSYTRFNSYNDIEYYKQNLLKSKDLYIPLSILEVSLRNSINNIFEKLYGAGWLINEASFLKHKELEKIYNAKNKLKENKKQITKDKLVSELNFGFWTGLFQSAYKEKMRINHIQYYFVMKMPY
jgi:hypothetical protein